jgi:hypothetical protein
VTRTQKLALAGSGSLLGVLLLVTAYVFATSTSTTVDGTSFGSSPGSSASTPTSSTPPPPVVLQRVSVQSGPDPANGWDTGVTLVFQGSSAPRSTVHPGGSKGSYTLTFSRPVSIDPQVLSAANQAGSPYLVALSWNAPARALTVRATAFTGNITPVSVTSRNRSTLRMVRQPTPRISNRCLALSKPRPYTALTGVSVAKGTADVFEGGPFTIAARVPGEGEAITKVKVLSGLVRFAAPYTLPTLPGPAEGVVAAWDTSAKDGSVICLVSVPVYFTHGG